MIALHNVSKFYDSFEAIHDMSFSVRPGEIVGLLGPNGAGKTTVMKIITGYHNAHAGAVQVCDVDVMLDPVRAKKHIGYLPENTPLYEDLFVLEYLRFVGLSRGIAEGDLGTAMQKVIDLCALSEFLGKPIASLSKGMKQRVGLAQAIIHDPDVVILDEPTSGLDPNQIKDIRTVIQELGKTKTVILSTHILQEVEILCSRILIVNKGKIVAEGTNAEIAAKLKGEDVYVLTAVTVDSIEDLKRSFQSIDGVLSVHVENETDNELKVLIRGESSRVNGENIFDKAVQSKIRVRELRKQSTSLESIFSSITTSSDSGADGQTDTSDSNIQTNKEVSQ